MADGREGLLHVSSFAIASRGKISLSEIRVPRSRRGQGEGTTFMEELCKIASAAGSKVVLAPSTDWGATSIARLEKFYKSVGFTLNRERNKDFSTQETMIFTPDPLRPTIQLTQDGSPVPPSKRFGNTHDPEPPSEDDEKAYLNAVQKRSMGKAQAPVDKAAV